MEIVTLVLNFLLSGSTIGVVIFYNAKRRKASAEAASAEGEVREQEFSIQKENIEFLSQRLQEAWGEVQKLQDMLNEKRDEILTLISKTKKLEIQIIESSAQRKKAEINSCLKVDCKERLKGSSKNSLK